MSIAKEQYFTSANFYKKVSHYSDLIFGRGSDDDGENNRNYDMGGKIGER